MARVCDILPLMQRADGQSVLFPCGCTCTCEGRLAAVGMQHSVSGVAGVGDSTRTSGVTAVYSVYPALCLNVSNGINT